MVRGRNYPDAIAVKDGKIVAVEVLKKIRRTRDQRGWSRGYRLVGGLTFEEKRRRYANFDDILFVIFYHDKDDIEKFCNSKKNQK